MKNNIKWYNPIDSTNTHEYAFVADKADFQGTDPWEVRLGKAVSNWNETIALWTESDDSNGIPDDVLQHCVVDLPVYSRRLRSALESGGISGIQYLPLCVRRPDGTQIPDYSIANIVNLIPALDADRSVLTRYGNSRPDRLGEISGILKPTLKAEQLQNFDIIRLAEFPLCYYVSQRFRDVFVKSDFTGYSFKEVPLL